MTMDLQKSGPRHGHGKQTLTDTGACEIKAAGPYEILGFGAIDVTKPYTLIWFGDIDAPKHYEFIGSGGFYFANTGKTYNLSFGDCGPARDPYLVRAEKLNCNIVAQAPVRIFVGGNLKPRPAPYCHLFPLPPRHWENPGAEKARPNAIRFARAG